MSGSPRPDPLPSWLAELEARHRGELFFAEVRRALQALSSLYVERRGRVPCSRALESAGKRAAYALYYGPLHFLVVRRVVRSLGASSPAPRRIVDLGCGTGAAGAAWAIEAGGKGEVLGIDRSAWAVAETRRTLRSMGLRGSARRGDLSRERLPGTGGAVVAAYSIDEVDGASRERLFAALLDAAERGARVLVVEPISKRVSPWWGVWAQEFAAAGGRSDSWRFPAELPASLRDLDRASGLDHAELTARSLFVAAGRERRRSFRGLNADSG